MNRKVQHEVFQELLTPIKQDFRIKIKANTKHIDELIDTQKKHEKFIHGNTQAIEDLRVTALYELQNKVKESDSYTRELYRMQ